MRRSFVWAFSVIPLANRWFNGPLRGVFNSIEQAVQGDTGVQVVFREAGLPYFPVDTSVIPRSKWLSNAIDRYRAFDNARPFVGSVKSGRIIGDYGDIVTSRDYLLGETASHGPQNPASRLYQLSFPEIEVYSGSAAFLSCQFHQNYYHWLIDGISRFELLLSVRRDFDWFVMPVQEPFQIETIGFFGLDPERCIAPSEKKQLKFDQVVFASSTNAFQAANKRGCEAVLRVVPGDSALAKPTRRLYISRQDAQYRRVENEAVIVENLREKGFEAVTLSGLSVVQQRQLFSEAAIIVAVHGAGLTNLIFCQPGTTVIEIGNFAFPNPCYLYLAAATSLNYRWSGAHPVGELKSGPDADLVVDWADLGKHLNSGAR